MKDFTLQLRCNVCDEALVAHWRADTAGVFAHVDPCQKCLAAQQMRALDVCPVCEGKGKVANTHGVEQFCIPCDGTGQRQ